MKIIKSLTPARLRIILIVSFILILSGSSALFYFVYQRLSTSATTTGEKVAQALDSQDTLKRLQKLKQELEDEKDTIDMVSRVMADSQNYAYQDRLISDLTTYAQRAGLTITNISFAAPPAAGQDAPATPTQDNTGAEAGIEGGEDATAGAKAEAPAEASSSLNKATVDITLETPTNYVSLLNFLHYVEQNLTKLKVSKVTMNKADDGVSVDALNLEVYVR